MDNIKQAIFSGRDPVKDPVVLFMDYNGWWAPLNFLYYSNSSKLLVSRHPESSIEEIVSHYCPQCLQKYVEDDVHTYKNRCHSCFQCPVCTSPACVVALTPEVCCFQCGMCCWRSDSSSLVGSDQQELESAVLERERDSVREDGFQALLTSFQIEEQAASGLSSWEKPPPAPFTPWTIGDAERAGEEKLKAFSQPSTADPRDTSVLYSFMNAQQIPNTCSQTSAAVVAMVTEHSRLTSLPQRLVSQQTGCNTAHAANLLPARVPLRTKKMLRCRKDVREGKMSILVQPKAHPLEGDSSHKLHQGKWWTKDASAVHFVPTVQVTGLPVAHTGVISMESEPRELSFLHLSLSNLKETDMIIRLEVLAGPAECEAEEGVDSSGVREEEAERHPPFLAPPSAVCPLRPSHETPAIFVSTYEDELLRDEQESAGDVPDRAAEHASGEWGVVRDNHTVKLCIPLASQSVLGTSSEGSREVVLAMYVQEASIAAPEAGSDEEQSLAINKDKAVRVFFRIVVPAAV